MARTNLTSQQVTIHMNEVLVGQGSFREAFNGTYIGGTRNQQEAVCKKFKSKYRLLEDEYFRNDFKIADKAIQYAHEWNQWCPHGKDILMTKGDVKSLRDGSKFLVEPLIRRFTKFTSNNGWIADPDGAAAAENVEVMEAFSHYTYHRSGEGPL